MGQDRPGRPKSAESTSRVFKEKHTKENEEVGGDQWPVAPIRERLLRKMLLRLEFPSDPPTLAHEWGLGASHLGYSGWGMKHHRRTDMPSWQRAGPVLKMALSGSKTQSSNAGLNSFPRGTEPWASKLKKGRMCVGGKRSPKRPPVGR